MRTLTTPRAIRHYADAEQKVYAVAEELGVKIMTDEELTAFTDSIEAHYVHPPEVNAGLGA